MDINDKYQAHYGWGEARQKLLHQDKAAAEEQEAHLQEGPGHAPPRRGDGKRFQGETAGNQEGLGGTPFRILIGSSAKCRLSRPQARRRAFHLWHPFERGEISRKQWIRRTKPIEPKIDRLPAPAFRG